LESQRRVNALAFVLLAAEQPQGIVIRASARVAIVRHTALRAVDAARIRRRVVPLAVVSRFIDHRDEANDQIMLALDHPRRLTHERASLGEVGVHLRDTGSHFLCVHFDRSTGCFASLCCLSPSGLTRLPQMWHFTLWRFALATTFA